MPDVQMNKGPLPSTAGGPAGSDGTPDGRYNFNSELLSGIDAYSYAESARMGSDKAYQQIPHRLQKIIPLLHVPDGKKGKQKLPISHAVDQGDIAFALALEPKRMPGVFYEKSNRGSFQVQNLSMLTPFCNFVTVNYLLAGLQIYHKHVNLAEKGKNDAWYQLWEALDPHWENHKNDPTYLEKNNHQNLKMLVRKFIPFGICAGSEHQGGKHELSYMPVQAAVNHVTTMTIDGQSRDLVNYWRDHNLDAGDQLGFHLEKIQISNTYTLNHYYKSYATANIEDVKECWQLVPSKLYPCTSNKYDADRLSPWEHGWWRVGQMMHFRGRHGETDTRDICSNDMIYLKGGLLQVTFAPVWHDYSRGTSGAPSVLSTSSTSAYFLRPPGAGGSSSSSRPRIHGHGTTGGGSAGGAGPGPAPPPAPAPPTGGGGGGGGTTWMDLGVSQRITANGIEYPMQSEDAIVRGGFILTCGKMSGSTVNLWKISVDKVTHIVYNREHNTAEGTDTYDQTADKATLMAATFGNGIEMLEVNVFKQKLNSGAEKYWLLQASGSKLELPAFDSTGILQLPAYKVEKDAVHGGYKITRRGDGKVMNSEIKSYPYSLGGFNLHWNGLLFIPGRGSNQTLQLGEPTKPRQTIADVSSIAKPASSISDQNQPVYSALGLFWKDGCFFEWNSRQYVEASGAVKTPPTDNTSKMVHSVWNLSKDRISHNNQTYLLSGQRFPISKNGTLWFSNGCYFKPKPSSPYPNDYEFVDAAGIPKSSNQIYEYDGCRIGVNYLTEWIVEYWDGVTRVYGNNNKVINEDSKKFLIELDGNSVFGSSNLPYIIKFDDGTARMIFPDGSFIQNTHPVPPAGGRKYTYYERNGQPYTEIFPKHIGDFSIHATIPAHNDKSFVVVRTSPDAYATADGTAIDEATFQSYTGTSSPAPAPAPPALTTSTDSLENTDNDHRLDLLFMRDEWWKKLPELHEGDNRWTIELDPSDNNKIINASKTYTVDREGVQKQYKVTLAYFSKEGPESNNESDIVKITDVADDSDVTKDFIYSVDLSQEPSKSQLIDRSEFVLSKLQPFLTQTDLDEPDTEIIYNFLVSDNARPNVKLSKLYCRLEVPSGQAERNRRGCYVLKVNLPQQYSPWKPNKSKVQLQFIRLTGFAKGKSDPEIRDFQDGAKKGFPGHSWTFEDDGTLKVPSTTTLTPDAITWFKNHFSWMSQENFDATYNALPDWKPSDGEKGTFGQAFDPEPGMEIDYTDPAPMPPANLLDKARSMFGGRQDPKAAAKRAAAEELTTKKAPGKRKISVVRDD